MIEKIMNRIVRMKPDVFRVMLWRNDTDTLWHTSATLRAAEGRTYAASAGTAELALKELEKVLLSLTCPTCGRMDDNHLYDKKHT